MGVKFSNTPPIFVKNTRVVLHENNTRRSLNKKTVSSSYHFIRKHMANYVAEFRKINTKENYAYPFTIASVSNDLHGFYHELMVDG